MERSSSYWYPGQANGDPVRVLNLLRRYRAAEKDMRRRSTESMRMGETDLLALRLLIRARSAGHPVRQAELAKELKLTVSATSALVDRLVRDGYVVRTPHPQDRRSVALELTAKTDGEVRATLAPMHAAMWDTVAGLTPEQATVVAGFLEGLIDAVSRPLPGEKTPSLPDDAG